MDSKSLLSVLPTYTFYVESYHFQIQLTYGITPIGKRRHLFCTALKEQGAFSTCRGMLPFYSITFLSLLCIETNL
jgi:hypothetical protein